MSQKVVQDSSTGISPTDIDAGCGMDGFLKSARKNASFRSKEATMNREIMNGPVTLDVEFTLPVVFHIISDDTILITDQEILDALKDLNDAFGKTGNYALSKGADTKIRFCLAKKDPDGGITNGITRTTSFFGNDLNKSIEDTRLKNLVKWDPEDYINIWYVKNIQNENFVSFGCAVTDGSQWRRIPTDGYATMPTIPLDSADGIVVSKFGPVLAHEMGHYLGLYHTFEGGCGNSNCNLSGDRVCDTPPDNSYLPSSCTDPANTCRSDTFSNYSNGYFRRDVPDQVTNFMDYGNNNCSNEFTTGQAVRMRAAIVTLRSSLLLNKCSKPCPDNIIADFTRDIPYPLPGQTINFTNTSTGAGKFQWLINDTPASASLNYSITLPDTGKYKISLKAYNDASCFAVNTDYVIVTCGVTARFFADKQLIASKTGFLTDSILFANTSVGGNSFKWLIGNDAGMAEKLVSSSKNLLYVFPDPGNYTVRLVATNGTCTDTTEAFMVPVEDPTPDGRVYISTVDCYQQTKLRVVFNICNAGYTPIPPGTPVSFYDADPAKPGANKIGSTFLMPDSLRGGGRGACCTPLFTEIVDVKKAGLNQIFVAFNDRGNELPLKFPNTGLIEKNYRNNIDTVTGFQYKVSVIPARATLLPGDSLQLTALATPSTSSSEYRWSPAENLSCSNCANPIVVADSTITHKVESKSEYGCTDSAFVNIKVPPAYDYAISLDKVECAANNDSINIDFTISNSYKRPVLPNGLTVAFYSSNPLTGIAKLLLPMFKLPANVSAKQANYSTVIKSMQEGTLYAVVNDNGLTFPLKLPNTLLEETNYANNIGSVKYETLKVIAANNGPLCEFDTIKLSAIASNDNAVYKWIGPAGFSSNDQYPILLNKSSQAAGPYKVTATYNGCSSVSASTSVNIVTAPVVTASTSSPVCETKTLNLKASSAAGVLYSWTGPNGFKSAVQNPVINQITAAGTGTYVVTAKTGNNCSSQPVSLSVKVSPIPVASFSAPDICLPSTTVNFKNESTISQGSIDNWLWNFGDAASGAANIDSVTDAAHVYSSYGKYIVTLKAISDAGCIATASNFYAGIHQQPLASFGNNRPLGVCVDDSLTFTDKSTGDEGTINKWTWETGDGSQAIVQNSNSEPVDYAYKKEGLYTVTLTVTNDFGCEHQATKPINVFPLPLVDAGQDIFILEGNSTNLRATASGNIAAYSWSPATYLSNATVNNPAVNSPLDDITYLLTVINQQGCKATDQVSVKLLGKLKIPNAFSPNGDGVNDVWNIPNLAAYPGAIVEIFDRYGKLVFRTVGYNKPWDGTRNGAAVPVGVYYYIVTPNNGAERKNGSVTLIR